MNQIADPIRWQEYNSQEKAFVIASIETYTKAVNKQQESMKRKRR